MNGTDFTEGNCTFAAKIVTRAAKSEIVGEHEDGLKIRVAAPPVDGAANTEIVKLLAKQFGVPKSDVHIISGQSSTRKRIRIAGLSRAAFEEILK